MKLAPALLHTTLAALCLPIPCLGQETATLFRHPKLEGNPWCLRFDSYGAGFIFVQNNDILRRFALEHPSGGKAMVRGSQSIEGTPPRQVFILQGYDLPKS